MISRHHAVIRQVEAGPAEQLWEITDAGSVNGIFVNDVKVDRHVLSNGDVIVFGGGGKTPFGEKKSQLTSEFVYVFSGKKSDNKQSKKKAKQSKTH
jgi:pSer/pThr/pTyr-binding forkhead associated (FHA) protein